MIVIVLSVLGLVTSMLVYIQFFVLVTSLARIFTTETNPIQN